MRTDFFTQLNIFKHREFKEWAKRAQLSESVLLEPFAGSNNLIKMLEELKLCNSFKSYDINPQDTTVEERNTLKDFPKGFKNIVTNPPFLAKNSATKNGFDLSHLKYDDLYKESLDLCLSNADFVAIIIPASFLQTGLFRERLSAYIMLPYENLFTDTDHPCCLALFEKEKQNKTKIYCKDKFLGFLYKLEAWTPKPILQ
jgi:hypothetical protein